MNHVANSSGRILIVDDQPVNLRVVSSLLSRQGYDVVQAGSGEEALACYQETAPDLVLLDMIMPGMDGFDLLKALQALPPPVAPVVFVTAAQDRDMLLRAFDAGVVDYVTKPFLPEELLARVNAHIGLKLARDRLERAAREREELVNLVAHDLKNPLSSVLFASDILRQHGCKPERIPHYIDVIHDSASDALGYIRHYLETRVGAFNGQSNAAAPLADTLHWLLRRYDMQLEASGIRVTLVPPPAEARVAIDERVLRQVAENLVTNAIKYAPNCELTLAGRNGAPGYWQLLVADRGPGISAEKQRELFKPFTRLNERNDGFSNGLGLALAKKIIANAGGQLWYEAREGGGAVFVIELPEATARPDG
ncbi:MAG TPA: hybrid sensor histidine kinase/response regulator [Lysobacter sp.]|jgi:two-component system sensor histidine kinase/response regulator|nr:hybrid sensor histidine kinase/response regulator [Lysobacter sp.]